VLRATINKRSTRQGSAAPAGGDNVTMQQLMETIRALQDAVAASRVDQDRFQFDLATSQANNEELHRTNEELSRNLQNVCTVDERAPPLPVRAHPMSFSQVIMDNVIPAMFMGPKVTFIGVEDPEAHITVFHTQIMLLGSSDAVYYKLFMSTLAGTVLDWFVSLPDEHITSFDQFTTLFREQYIVNRAPPPISYDLFDVRQYQGESLKEFLNRFGVQVVKLHTKDEAMTVHAFTKGVLPGAFSDSLIRCCPKTFCEIRRRVVAHIVAEDRLTEKHGSVFPVRPRGTGRPQPTKVHEATKEKKAPGEHPLYEARKPQTRARTRENTPPRHDFRAPSAYNILLGRPSFKRIGAVASSRHMKMKLSSLEGVVITMKSDQKEAKRCCENSLMTKSGVCSVTTQPPREEGVTCLEIARERRPELVEEVLEREIGGKMFKLGRSLGQEAQDQIVEVIARHMDAFAWSASDMPVIDPDFLCHHLTMDPKVRPVRQRWPKFNDDRQLVIREETQKLLTAGHIKEIQYPE